MPINQEARLRSMGFQLCKPADIRKQIEIETYLQEMAIMGSKNEDFPEADRKAFGGAAHMSSIRLLALRAALGMNTTTATSQPEASVSSS